ncbi:hypothetical protein N7524_001099, partial [Penicillium chrysogenum]
RPLVVDILLPTISPIILTIDSGRHVVFSIKDAPLSYLYYFARTITLRPEGRGSNFNVAYNLGDKNDNSIKSDSYRLNIPLGNTSYTINAIEAIEDYRDLIILYISSRRIARDIATILLISRFFFIVDLLLENTITLF